MPLTVNKRQKKVSLIKIKDLEFYQFIWEKLMIITKYIDF